MAISSFSIEQMTWKIKGDWNKNGRLENKRRVEILAQIWELPVDFTDRLGF